MLLLLGRHLSLLVAEDIRVTGIDDGQGGAAEELTAGGTELNLCRGYCVSKCEPSKVKDFFAGQNARVTLG